MLVAFASVTSCMDNSVYDTSMDVPSPTEIKTTHISREKAMAALKKFTDNLMRDSLTRSCRDYNVKDIISVSLDKSICCRSDDEEENEAEEDDVLYFMNFEDGGYAILSADSRIQEDIIAVVEDGDLSQEDISTILSQVGEVEYPEFDGSQDLSYLSECSRDSIGNWINPEGEYVSPYTPYNYPLYDSTRCDFLSGDLSDDIVAVDRLRRDTLKMSPRRMIVRMSFNWAVNNLIQNTINGPDDEDCSLETNQTVSVDTVFSTPVQNMLQGDLALWCQQTPFNGYCPTVHHPILFWKTKKAPCGCVVLALAEMMAVMRFPSSTLGEGSPGWTAIRSIDPFAETNSSIASNYLKVISKYCHPLYLYGGTFTFPSLAKKALQHFGYENVKYQNYSADHVHNTLDAGSPVFVCSIPVQDNNTFIYIAHDLPQSHAWVIDGYKRKEVIETIRTYNDGVLSMTDRTQLSSCDYVHCVFGWHGSDNGYFLSGVFDFMSNETMFDNPTNSQRNLYFAFHLKTITFDNPNGHV